MSSYIESLRLRTLPLSMSGIILGTGLAMRTQSAAISGWQWLVFALAICTTLSLQILSNLCNELGDAQKGTDANQKGRQAYGLQAGTITVSQMKGMIATFIATSVVFGIALIYCAFGSLWNFKSLIFICLGALAIIGAITYTLGKHSYGYMGLGDLGVFLFFGLLSTMGAFYLQAQCLTADVIWSAIAIGLPIVGVLNLNNVRDMDNDRAHEKRTFASWLGKKGGKIYHATLLAASLAIFAVLGHFWVLVMTPVWLWHIAFIFRHDGHDLDRQMPVLMFTTIFVSGLALV